MSAIVNSVIGGVLRRSMCRSTGEITKLSRTTAAATLATPHLANTTRNTAPITSIRLHFHTTSTDQDAETIVQQEKQIQDNDTSSANAVAVAELDKLYSSIEVECRSTEPAVLSSYLTFIRATAGYLDVTLEDVKRPRYHWRGWTLLKSVHIHKKHRVQYEVRTHFLIMKFVRLTGSTANTFLEYIQRNLPEGVSMKVTKNELQKLPDHIK